MLRRDGESLLTRFAAAAYPPTVTEVVPRTVFHVLGFGHSNASFIIAERSVILVDTLDTDVRGSRLAAIIAEHTDKPVRTIIYTHGHPDHLGGGGSFAGANPEVIAFAPARPQLPRTESLNRILNLRGALQFGYDLTDEEAISQGYGIREGFTVGEGVRSPLPPTTIYQQEAVQRDIDGVSLSLIAAPGESEDQCAIWLDVHKVLLCGDNYCGCWPNLYAIRGGQYRDVAGWIATLDRLRQFPAEALLPGHTRPILGQGEVAEVLENFRNALDFVLSKTLECMNRGLGLEATVAAVSLPEEYARLPYLQEFYGTVAWSVRAIYTGYLGWFDGDPRHLNPLPPTLRAARFVDQMGGTAAVVVAVTRALADGDPQWALELADLVLTLDIDNAEVRRAKVAALQQLARHETSANGRHYYLAYAKTMLDDFQE